MRVFHVIPRNATVIHVKNIEMPVLVVDNKFTFCDEGTKCLIFQISELDCNVRIRQRDIRREEKLYKGNTD
jgi:hypothetical protein